jgi:NADP-dependent 3-hydroxy acid dehydrogenase YdfG
MNRYNVIVMRLRPPTAAGAGLGWATAGGHADIRVTLISPGLTQTELDVTITDAKIKRWMEKWRTRAIPSDAIARAILFPIEQPENVDVSEIIVRHTNER